MDKNTIRPYEMSVWTLRDGFLATLKAPGVENKGHIQEPKLVLNIDGTQELSFKVPMYYFEDNQMIENPYWYDVKNGLLLVGMRKIKLIFNKNSYNEEVYEFIVTEINEDHADDGTLFCEVTGSGLAFQELGKKGYKINLSEDDYYNDMNDYYDKIENGESVEKPINNINYWCDKVFKNSDWFYTIQMDWSDYDGILYRRVRDPRNELYYGIELIDSDRSNDNAVLRSAKVGLLKLGSNGLDAYGTRVGIARVDYSILTSSNSHVGNDFLNDLYNNFVNGEFVSYSDLMPQEQLAIDEWKLRTENINKYRSNRKIYENEYVTSWHVDENNQILTPVKYEKFKEKFRMINESDSNIYNLTQAIAEQFGVFCKYKYYYDDNYHIIKKEVIFYNSFTNEFNQAIDLNYGYNTSSINRKMDSNDLCTKLIVKNIDDDSTALGTISIANTSANRSGEDYIFNFEYLHDIGAIEEDQYQEVAKFETNMRKYNDDLINISNNIIKLEDKLVEKQAELTMATNAYTQYEDQYNEAIASKNTFINSVATASDGSVTINKRTKMILKDNKTSKYYIDLTNEQPGIKQVELYSSIGVNSTVFSASNYSVIKDKNNFITKIYPINNFNSLEKLYVTYKYYPQLYYNVLANNFQKLQTKEGKKKIAAQNAISTLKSQLNQLKEQQEEIIIEKNNYIADFEKMMGPALREGTWQPEEYNDYGDIIETNFSIPNTNVTLNGNGFFWDSELFDDEELNYEEIGLELQKQYYPFIIITDDIYNAIIPYINNAEYFIKFKTTITINGSNNIYYYTLGSNMKIAFLKKNNDIYPVLLFNGINEEERNLLFNSSGTFQGANSILCRTKISSNANTTLVSFSTSPFNLSNANTYSIVYPRYYIQELSLLTSDDMIHIFNPSTNENLKKYDDYSLLTRNNGYYITLTPEKTLLRFKKNTAYKINYTLSNAELNIYLDAKEVLKSNAYPQVSYEMSVAMLDTDLIKNIYKQLNCLAHINDYELKFENIKGYISNLELNLDQPWKDEIEIKNYKTKFEDLFTKIVATTEQMRTNALIYDKVASAFNAAGNIKENVLQSSVMSAIDLSLAFNKGSLIMNETNGIQAQSEEGVVAFSGGGIFCATSKDDDNNWIWHTGIVPSGINASLITAGQINTNLIKIYAGDNLRFQMNGEGLFAYNNDQTQYVVHDEDGLFLIAKEGYHVKNNPTSNDLNNYKINSNGDLTQDIKRVSISWNGIELKNYNNVTVFSADSNTGNLSITGNITTTGGKIGGFQIDSNSIHTNGVLITNNATESVGLSSSTFTRTINGTSRSNLKFAIGSNFGVTNNGTLYASSGIIGGWTIDGSKKRLSAGSGNNYVALNTSTVNNSDYTFWVGNVDPQNAAFSIKKDGTINIQSSEDDNKILSIESGTMSADYITASNIADKYAGEFDLHLSSTQIYDSRDNTPELTFTSITALQTYIEENLNNHILTDDITITVHGNFSGKINIERITGMGSITINSNSTTVRTITGTLKCNNCYVPIIIENIRIQSSSDLIISTFNNCNNVLCSSCTFTRTANKTSSIGINIINSHLIINNCSFNDNGTLINIEDLSHVFIKKATFIQNTGFSVNKWLIVKGSVVHVNNTNLTFTNVLENNKSIVDGAVYEASGTVSGGSTVTGETITKKSSVVSGTVGSIKNGVSGSSFKIKSPTIPANARLNKATLTMTRVSGYGVGAGRPVNLPWYLERNTNTTWLGGSTHTLTLTDYIKNGLADYGSYNLTLDKFTAADYFTIKVAEASGYTDYVSGKNYSQGYMKFSNCYITVEYEMLQ